MDENEEMTSGLTRRDMLRKGAIVGGALVWTAPVVQSLAGPAFAQTGSPGGEEVCTQNYQFKINAGSTTFETGQTPDCTPTGYDPNGSNFVAADGTIPNGHGTISVSFSADGNCATITVPADCKLLDGQAKAGSDNGGTLECVDASFTSTNGVTNVYTVCLNRDISFVAGVICC